MPIIIKKGQDFEPVPPGIHLARVFRVIDLGTQPGDLYGAKHKLLVSWELPGLQVEVNGKKQPMSINQFYGFTLGKRSTLKEHLQNWRGRAFTEAELCEFNISAILGKPCQLNVVENDRGRSVVSTILGCPKGLVVPPAINPPVEFSAVTPDWNTWKILPEWLQDICTKAQEWPGPPTLRPQPPQRPGNITTVPGSQASQRVADREQGQEVPPGPSVPPDVDEAAAEAFASELEDEDVPF